MPSFDTDSHRDRKSPVLPTDHREARKQQGGREAEPIANPAHRLRRTPESRVARRALRYPRDRSVAAARRWRGPCQRTRERDRAESRTGTETFLQGRNGNAEEHDRAQEAYLCTRFHAPHRQRYVQFVHSFTAAFRLWSGKFTCHQRWFGFGYGYDEQGPSPRFGVRDNPRKPDVASTDRR